MTSGKNSFTEFKKDFYTRITDFSIFNCEEFNLLKVVLDGLKVKYSDKGKIRTYMFYPIFIYKFFLFFKRSKEKKSGLLFKLKKYQNIKTLIVDSGRINKDENGKFVSLYFYNFYKNLKNFVSITESLPVSDFYHHDFTLKELTELLQYEPLDKEEIQLRKKLMKSFNIIKSSEIFDSNELDNIKIALYIFFNHYRVWNRIFKIISPEKCYFICHYHKEGFLLALKRNNIKAIELQHGLIAPQDIFYMFPDSIKLIKNKALFADEIWVYGKFWKDRLLSGAEYSDEQIKIIGYYLHENREIPLSLKNKLADYKNGKKIILITTQTYLSHYFVNYIKFLSKELTEKNYNYNIWVKPHPAEPSGFYNNALAGIDNIVVLEENLEYLFQFADMHLSIYSTTLYDACRYNLPSFSLFNKECSDYVHTIVESGIAKIIYENQNPVELLNRLKDEKKSDLRYFYSDFNKELLMTNILY